MPMPGLVPKVIMGSSAAASREMVRSKRAPGSLGSVRQRASARSQAAPIGAAGRPARYWKVTSSGADQPRAGAALDGHVAHRHALLHVEGAHATAGELEDVAGAAAHADAGDEGQDDVLGRDAGREPPVHADLVVARAVLQEALGGEHVLDLAGADSEGERAERSVGGGVAVAADDGHARLGQPLLRPHHVDDPLRRAAASEERHLELAAILLELAELGGGLLVDHRAAGGNGVVGGGGGEVGAADPELAPPEAGEGLRRGDLVDQVAVDVEDGGGALLLRDHV